jgi:hypothetical protein
MGRRTLLSIANWVEEPPLTLSVDTCTSIKTSQLKYKFLRSKLTFLISIAFSTSEGQAV